MSVTSVVIAENDAPWAEWASSLRAPAHALLLLVQGELESQERFFERVKQRIDRVHRQGQQLARIVLVAGGRWDGAALQSRAQMLRKLLARLSARGSKAQLVLDCGPKDGPSCLGMNAIADALNECVAGAPAHLRLVAGAGGADDVA